MSLSMVSSLQFDDPRFQKLVGKYGAKNVENALILISMANTTDEQELRVCVPNTLERLEAVLSAIHDQGRHAKIARLLANSVDLLFDIREQGDPRAYIEWEVAMGQGDGGGNVKRRVYEVCALAAYLEDPIVTDWESELCKALLHCMQRLVDRGAKRIIWRNAERVSLERELNVQPRTLIRARFIALDVEGNQIHLEGWANTYNSDPSSEPAILTRELVEDGVEALPR